MNDELAVSLDASAVPATPAGAGRYVMALAHELDRLDGVGLSLLTRRHDASRWHPLVSRGRVAAVAPERRPARLAWEQLGLPRRLAAQRPHVHHGPHYTAPARRVVPTVVTIHDCTFFDHPEWHERSKVLLFRRAIAHAARHADALICVSEATATRLQELCDVRAPLFVAPHGVDHHRFTPEEPEEGGDRRILRRLGLDPEVDYVLFTGTIEPRKGLVALLQAFARLTARRPSLRLVLAGREGWGSREVSAAVDELALQGRVIRTGYVPDEAVPPLLRHASAVAYPSLAEGYGLPALEALACGAPLVTTEGTSMAEVAEAAAVLVPPGAVSRLAEGLEGLLDEDATAAAERRRAGLEVARQHTWAKSAARHLDAYRHAAGRR